MHDADARARRAGNDQQPVFLFLYHHHLRASAFTRG
jgi:hypothetical protein